MSYSLPKNSLTDLLSQPTVIAILASVGIHGLVGLSWDWLPFSDSDKQPNTWTTVDLVNLTSEEVSRLPDFSSPQATGLGSLNSSSGQLGSLPELGPLPPSPTKLGIEPLTLPKGTPLYDLPFDLPPAPSLGDLKTPLPSLQDYQSPSNFREGLTNPPFSGNSNSMAIEELLALERLERAQIEREIEQRDRQRLIAAENNSRIGPPPAPEFRLQDVPPPPITPRPEPPSSIDQQIARQGMNQEVDPSQFFEIPYREDSPPPELSNGSGNANQSRVPPSRNIFESNELPYGVNPGMAPSPTQPPSEQTGPIGRAADLQTEARNTEPEGTPGSEQAVVPPNVPTQSDRPGETPAPAAEPGVTSEKVREIWDQILAQKTPANPTGSVSDRQNAMLEGTDAYIQWVSNLEAEYGEVNLKNPIAVSNQYPLEACSQKLEGRALFGVLVDPKGQIIESPRRLLGTGQDILDSFARKWVQNMRFTPGSEPAVYQYAFEFKHDPQLCRSNAPSQPSNAVPPVETQPPQLDAPRPTETQTAPPQLDAPRPAETQTAPPPQLDAPRPAETQTAPPQLDAPRPAETQTAPPQLDAPRPAETQTAPPQLDAPPATRPQQLRNPAPAGEPSKPVNVPPQAKPDPVPVQGEPQQEPSAPVEVQPEPAQGPVPVQVQPPQEQTPPVESPVTVEGEEVPFLPDGFDSTPSGETQVLPLQEATEGEVVKPTEETPESETKSEAQEEGGETEVQTEAESSEAIADEEESDPEN